MIDAFLSGLKVFEISPGLVVTLSDFKVEEDFDITSTSPAGANLGIFLQGSFEIIRPGHLGMINSKEMWVYSSCDEQDMTSRIYAGDTLLALDLNVHESWFETNIDLLSKDKSFESLVSAIQRPWELRRLPLSPEFEAFANSFLASTGDSFADKLVRESRAIDGLLALNKIFSNIHPNLRARDGLSKADRDRIWSVRKAVEENPAFAKTLSQLAKQVGISVSKLKRDFQNEFSETIGSFILEQRMQTADRMLREGERVSVVAYRLGYSHPESFSASFKKHFGVSPSKI
ncbi:MAG: AraC family transcriptional regulator [Cohaesibacter sp.]|nr:AraC family transcriptional regulator [Cohaesibacter sp.]MCV6600428.1 AraC family transcriptional regulator [Cohaesibacter sp.]